MLSRTATAPKGLLITLRVGEVLDYHDACILVVYSGDQRLEIGMVIICSSFWPLTGVYKQIVRSCIPMYSLIVLLVLPWVWWSRSGKSRETGLCSRYHTSYMSMI